MLKKKISALSLLVCVLAGSSVVFAQQRGIGVRVKTSNGQTSEINLYDGSYALIIGESDYTNGWDKLSGVRDDVVAVRNILQRQGFRVETAENLTSLEIKPRIDKFIKEYGYEKNNRLLIYYAGHGYTLKSVGDNRELGYIVPVDSPVPEVNEKGFRQTAISMKVMQTYAEEIQAKHALFVFDSCFSGKIFALRDNPKLPPVIEESVANPVRQIITAGDENQKVPDDSVFRKAFVRGLEGEADYNKDGYITGIELGMYLKDKVTTYTNRRQTPRFGTINDIDLDRGDMVFEIPPKAEGVDLNKIYSLSEVDQKPKIISVPKAGYTDSARMNQVQGLVRLKVVLQSSGTVGSITPVTTLPDGLTEKAVAAARKVVFQPALKNGVPVTTQILMDFPFSLY